MCLSNRIFRSCFVKHSSVNFHCRDRIKVRETYCTCLRRDGLVCLPTEFKTVGEQQDQKVACCTALKSANQEERPKGQVYGCALNSK